MNVTPLSQNSYDKGEHLPFWKLIFMAINILGKYSSSQSAAFGVTSFRIK